MTKVTNKRVKVTVACIICRKKKVKCDGIQPACSRCGSNGIECQYSNSYKKRGPPKIRIEIIENRMHRIKTLLQPKQLIHSELNNLGQVPVNTLFCLITEAVEQKKSYGSNDMMSYFSMNSDHIWSELYFTHFNNLFPLLSQSDFKQNNDPLLNFAVCALGSLYGLDRHHSVLFERAQHILHASTVQYSISTVQALIILCWYSHLIGDAKKCEMLRYQLAQAIDWLQCVPDVEIKRRTYWIAWVMDQWIASCTLSERMIHEWSCQWPQSEEAFIEFIRLSLILKDIHQGTQTSETDLTAWLLNLPSFLDYNKSSSVITKIYRILYYTAQMILNQHHQHQSSHSICITAANTILYITQQMVNLGQASFALNTFFISLTFATSFIHLNSNDCLSKPICLLNQINCTLLSKDEFDQLLQNYFYIQHTPSLEFCGVEQLLSDWSFIDNESYTTTSTTSPISYYSPTQSPLLKDEFILDTASFFY
ncbi:hypothetical protein G6F43_010679 [Rhizopus delemar]|nr:hypothetical protein G6F43_010679 [Rhizopus delemar]